MWQAITIWAAAIALCWGLLWLVIRMKNKKRSPKFRIIQGGKK